jgi:hypothetical protein
MAKGKPGTRISAILLQCVLVAWVAGLTLYFEHREGLLNGRVWDWVFGQTDHARLYTYSFGELFSGGYHIWWNNIPWGGICGSLLALCGLWIAGWLFLDCFEIYIPFTARIFLALACGTGVAGIPFEMLAMVGILYRWTAILAWVLIIAALFVWRERRAKRMAPLADGLDPYFSARYRAEQAREWYAKSVRAPFPGLERVYYFAAMLIIGIISILVLLHGVCLPETYWDSLILYMGYARKTFLQHGFPVKVVGQVGIGLGANYPHLFAVLSAQTAAIAGNWQDVFAQFYAPVFGLGSTVLVYYTAQEISRDKLIAISAALLFRAVPDGLAYNQYASDYALAIFFTAAFLYLACKYCLDGLPQYRTLMILIAAFSVHVNYLMWILWIAAAAFVFFAHVKRISPTLEDIGLQDATADQIEENTAVAIRAPRFLEMSQWQSPVRLSISKPLWKSLLIGVAVACPWYIRNIIVTGNPVYAFFYNIFPSRHVNPAVMRSAEVEWMINGDGLRSAGRTVAEKFAHSWQYFVTGPLHWRLAPVFMAFCISGFVVTFLLPARKWFGWNSPTVSPASSRFLAGCIVLFTGLWFYAYVIADYYLYQIIIVLPIVGILSCVVFAACQSATARTTLYVLTLLIGIAPGIIMGAMGFKLKRSGTYGDRLYSQAGLTALKNLFIDPETFYTLEFDGDEQMFQRLRSIPTGRVILTHENRHLLLDERLKIVHLDDWEVQSAYGKPPKERAKILRNLGIDYYLYVPNEDSHRANSWLGMDELIRLGYFNEMYRTPASGSSHREGLDYTRIPPDKNVLYRASWR